MKKGATHADWAVSLGIFLIYTLSLFLLIQPGVEPIFRNENLIKIVDNAFLTEINLEIEKTPVIFTPVSIETSGTYVADIQGDIPLEGVDLQESDFYVTDETGNPLNFRMTFELGNTIVNRLTVEGDFTDTGAGVVPVIFYVYYSRENGYPASGPIIATTVISDTTPNLNFTRIFGSKEIISGIDNERISVNPVSINFDCANVDQYNAWKNDWDYPLNKDFQIFMIPTSNPRYTADDINQVCNQTQPFQQTSVFVQEKVLFVIDRFGNREPVRINMRVW